MNILIHNPDQPLVILAPAGEQTAMRLAKYTGNARYVQLHLWLPEPVQNTARLAANQQQINDDNGREKSDENRAIRGRTFACLPERNALQKHR